MPPSVLYGLADLLRHRWRCLRSGAVFGAMEGQSDGTLESVCYPGDLASWWGSFMLPREASYHLPTALPWHLHPQRTAPFSEIITALGPSAWALLQASLGSVCAEGLLVFHESFESHCPLFLHLSDTNTEVLKGTCCCWSLAVTIVPRDCESSSLRPVSCFRGNPESQMITYELLTLLDKWVTVHNSCPPTGLGGSWWGGWILPGTGTFWDGHLDRVHGEFRIWILVTPLGGFQCVFILHCSWMSPAPMRRSRCRERWATCTWLAAGREGVLPCRADGARKFPSSSQAALICPGVLF